ncbi:MAG: beta-ketoacyl synthase N-terminal-like domain-containing protein [Actinocatenispora sp.]
MNPSADAPGTDPRIAVIGMSFRFPGADTPEEFWRVIRDGTDCVTRFTEEELAAAGVPAEKYRAPGFVGASGLVEDIAGFDAQFFGMSAREARTTDPQHRMFLECAHHALENSGYAPERGDLTVGVYASTGYHLYSMQNYLLNNVLTGPVDDDWVSRLQTMVGNYPDFTATRTAFRLGLTGPAVSVQTACSSSLVAVQLAAQSVLAGDCDIALAGATAVHVPQVLGYDYVKGSILSKSGHLRAFDAGADGTVGGTGVAALVLKRLSRAVADGDTVHGVIRGWGVTNDGSDKRAYSAPSAAGQQAAIRRALTRAQVSADTIGYLETHGTGTLKGDPIEFDGATAAFRADSGRAGYCALGSTKANIGHLDVCSGLASLIKALLVLRHGVIPPLAKFTRANPALDLDNSPFYIPRVARPWPAGDTPRRAGVTSLGMGGTNVHLVVEEAPEPAPRSGVASPGVLLLSGRSEAARAANAGAFRDHLRRHPGTDLADLATTTAAGRSHWRHRLAVRGTNATEFADALDAWLAGGHDAAARHPAPITGSVARECAPGVGFLFTGQGSSYRGMARPLYQRFPAVRAVLDTCERHHRAGYGGSLLDGLLGAGDRSGAGADAAWDTDTAQPALFALQCAVLALWREAGVVPTVVAGHSVGEYAALCAAGALSVEDGLRLTAERGRLMQRYCEPGGMVAVAADHRTAASLAADVPGVEVAVVNGEHGHVLAGPVAAVDRLSALLAERGIPGERLPVTRAFHTAMMEPALAELRVLLRAVAYRPGTVPFASGLDGRVRPAGWTPDADYLVAQARRPVRFDAALRELGGTALVELGPHTTLSGLARRALPGVLSVQTLRRGAGLEPLWDAAARLHCAGVDVDWQVLVAGCGGGRIPLPGYRFQHENYWTGPEPTAIRSRRAARMGTDVAQDEQRPARTEDTAPVERVLRHVIEVTARSLGCGPGAVTGDTSFFDLGADSLQMIAVLRELEQEHQVKIAMRELFEETGTPRRLAELVAGRMAGGPQPAAGQYPAPAPAPSLTPPSSVSAEPERAHAAPEPTRPLSPAAAEPATAEPAGAQPAAVEPAATEPAAPEYATRQELADLARQIHQLSQIQLQLMSQLSQLLAPQTAVGTGTAPANGRAGA